MAGGIPREPAALHPAVDQRRHLGRILEDSAELREAGGKLDVTVDLIGYWL